MPPSDDTGSATPGPVLVVMGVSGSGKSTVAAELAHRLSWEWEEGDELHPPANVAKMHAGHPLTDADRWPWLDLVAAWIHQRGGRPGIITCSALKRSYRDVLRGPAVTFVYLQGSPELLTARIDARQGHFMPSSLLQSQLDALQPPGPDEQAITIDVGGSPADIATTVIDRLHLTPTA